jgi:hypothetical protein
MNQGNLQAAIYTRLDSQLTVPVYDHVPQDAAFPYVTIGDDTSVQWDTDTNKGSTDTLTIHAWSRFAGRSQVKAIMKSIYSALHIYNLDITGASTVLCQWEFGETFLDPDGVTRHGVMRFRIIQEAT